MTTAAPSTLEEAIRKSGEGWLLDYFQPHDRAIEHYVATISAVNALAKKQFGAKAPDLSENGLLREFQERSQHVRAFFQAMGVTSTPDMLLMVWRIIQGLEIEEVSVSYHLRREFEARVVLRSLTGLETYASNNIRDFYLLRHLEAREVHGLPVFDGFSALRLGK
jgi:hypothetical protein